MPVDAKLQFSYLTDEKGERQIDPKTNAPTLWGKHWDNDNRRAILMHEDTLKAIKADKDYANLATKTPVTKEGAKGNYDMVLVINYAEATMGEV